MPSKNFCRVQECWEKRGKLRRRDEGEAKNTASIKQEGGVMDALFQ